MGRKVNPKAIRIGINRTWDSVWYTDKSKYPKLLQEDLMIREEVRKSMKDAGLDSVKTEVKKCFAYCVLKIF